jgi:hypothetical protein
MAREGEEAREKSTYGKRLLADRAVQVIAVLFPESNRLNVFFRLVMFVALGVALPKTLKKGG